MERVLVCILAQTRSHRVAWPSFKHHVLDELNADLALAVTLDEKYEYANPYWQHAKYRWTAAEADDVGDAFDLAQRWLCHQHNVTPPDWRSLLRIKGIWQGGIRSPDPQPSRAALSAFFCRWLLLHGLQQDGALDRYDRFVVTRSDYVWLCPHPPLSILDRESLWIPDGEHYGSLCDRHLVVSRKHATDALNLIDDILLRPDELYEEMTHADWNPDWNPEKFLAHHLARKGLLPRVKLFPYVMYTARGVRDPRSSWSRGSYDPSVGHIVKHREELHSARAYATVINTREDWERGAWRTFDAKLAAAQRRPSAVERLWGALWPIRNVSSALWRPGRVARLGRYYQRTRERREPPRRTTLHR